MVPFTWKQPLQLAPKFFCNECWERFKKAWITPMAGIDRPADAPDDWQPSLMEHLRHARIALEHEERLEREKNIPIRPIPRTSTRRDWRNRFHR